MRRSRMRCEWGNRAPISSMSVGVDEAGSAARRRNRGACAHPIQSRRAREPRRHDLDRYLQSQYRAPRPVDLSVVANNVWGLQKDQAMADAIAAARAVVVNMHKRAEKDAAIDVADEGEGGSNRETRNASGKNLVGIERRGARDRRGEPGGSGRRNQRLPDQGSR